MTGTGGLPSQGWRLLRIGVALVVLGAAATVTVAYAVPYVSRMRSPALPEGLIQANGRIEGDEILVAGKHAGRIRELRVREGEPVSTGELLALLDDEQATARADQARAVVDQALSQVEQARESIAKTQAAEEQARRDAERFRPLADRGIVPRRQAEEAELAWSNASRDLSLARALLAQTTAGVAQARAGVREAEQARADLRIAAPSTGTVTTLVRNTGEVVAAGAPILSLVDLDRLYLKVYVTEHDVGKVRLGLPARIYTDAYPDLPVAAHVGFIASRAEFTPKEVQTQDERTKLVFAVKLYVDENPRHALTPGMPADAVIRWREGARWTKPSW